MFAAALVAGLLPALSTTGKTMLKALQTSARTGASSVSRTALRKSLLTAEIAITVVLLVAAGLLLKSFLRLRSANVGCVTENMLTLQYSLPEKKFPGFALLHWETLFLQRDIGETSYSRSRSILRSSRAMTRPTR